MHTHLTASLKHLSKQSLETVVIDRQVVYSRLC